MIKTLRPTEASYDHYHLDRVPTNIFREWTTHLYSCPACPLQTSPHTSYLQRLACKLSHASMMLGVLNTACLLLQYNCYEILFQQSKEHVCITRQICIGKLCILGRRCWGSKDENKSVVGVLETCCVARKLARKRCKIPLLCPFHFWCCCWAYVLFSCVGVLGHMSLSLVVL